MEKMAGKIDVLLSLEITTDFAKTTTQDVQLLLHSTHKDEQALAEYAGHPIHVDLPQNSKNMQHQGKLLILLCNYVLIKRKKCYNGKTVMAFFYAC